MSRLRRVPEPSIITVRSNAQRATDTPPATPQVSGSPRRDRPAMTVTGAIGAICMFPLRAIISACVALRIHPNTLTLIGVIINVAAAWALGYQQFWLAFVLM